MPKKLTFHVIGSGITGCTVARCLKDKGHNVTVYENDDLGGLCTDGLHLLKTEPIIHHFLSRFTDIEYNTPRDGFVSMFNQMLDGTKYIKTINPLSHISGGQVIYTGRLDELLNRKYGELHYPATPPNNKHMAPGCSEMAARYNQYMDLIVHSEFIPAGRLGLFKNVDINKAIFMAMDVAKYAISWKDIDVDTRRDILKDIRGVS